MILENVSFVLLLRDDLTGADIAGGAHRFFVDGRPASPVRKPEGYCVFTGPFTPCEVRVESALYSPVSVWVDPMALERRSPVVTLRLLRRGDVRFQGCERAEGRARPGAMVRAFARQAPPLLFGAQEDDVLELQSYTARSLLRLRFAVGEGQERETFEVVERRPDGTFRISPPLRRRHRAGEPIERAYAALCADDGRFALTVEAGALERLGPVEYLDGEVGQWLCLSAAAPS